MDQLFCSEPLLRCYGCCGIFRRSGFSRRVGGDEQLELLGSGDEIEGTIRRNILKDFGPTHPAGGITRKERSVRQMANADAVKVLAEESFARYRLLQYHRRRRRRVEPQGDRN